MITPPPFLLGFTLLFWGWQSQLLLIALPLALLLEAARWLHWRLPLSNTEFNRLTDLTTLVSVMLAFYLFLQHALHGLLTFINLLPLVLGLLIAAQQYSTQGSIQLSSLFLSLRRRNDNWAQRRIDMAYPYIVISLLAASVRYQSGFFLGCVVISIWALSAVRPQRYPKMLWGSLIIIASILAYGGQQGLYQLQGVLEAQILEWLEHKMGTARDPLRQQIAVGELGRLKQSERILFRVHSRQPMLLRQASYNSYFRATWRAKQTQFITVSPGPKLASWFFAPSPSPLTAVTISTYLPEEQSLLALPHGTHALSSLPVLNLEYNTLGSVQVEHGPPWLEYTAYFQPHHTPLDSAPNEHDLFLFPQQQIIFTKLAHTLNLHKHTPIEAIDSLKKFFEQNFKYSLDLNHPLVDSRTPLENFLLYHRQGHCEYFATATVLLLRSLGIPARYAVGYAVEEWSELEQLYRVRQRHAHAWALAYVEGHWQAVDTTPPDWLAVETAAYQQWYTQLYDWGSWLRYQFARWRMHKNTLESTGLWLLGIPIGLILAWSIYRKQKVKLNQNYKPKNRHLSTGLDSDFYKIIHRLNACGWVRLPGETLPAWLARIPLTPELSVDIETILALYQRHRFDPLGLSQQEQQLLKKSVIDWLHQFNP